MNVDSTNNFVYKYQFSLLIKQLLFSGWFDSTNIKEQLKSK